MTPIERLQCDQRELLDASAALRALAEQPTPPPRAVLSAARWRIARMLLRHLPLQDRAVYARLRNHADPAVHAIAKRFADEAAAIYAMSENHSRRWTPGAVEADWEGYRDGVRQQQLLLKARFAREATELLPHLATAPDIPVTRSPDDRNWAADGWKFRELLEIEGPVARTAAI